MRMAMQQAGKQAGKVEVGKVEVNGATLAYEFAGAGPSLVLIHASVADSRMWNDQFLVFAEQFRVLRYDLRDYGKSSRATAPYADLADLTALLDHFGITQTHLVGASTGGSLALDFAARYPDRAQSLVLASTGLRGYTNYSTATLRLAMQIQSLMQAGESLNAIEAMLHMWMDGTRAAKQVDVSARMKVHRMLADNAHTILGGDFALTLDPPTIEVLNTISTPTLLLVGEKDIADILDITELILEQLPANVDSLAFPDSGHLINMELPAEFNQVVLTFLNSHRDDQRTG